MIDGETDICVRSVSVNEKPQVCGVRHGDASPSSLRPSPHYSPLKKREEKRGEREEKKREAKVERRVVCWKNTHVTMI